MIDEEMAEEYVTREYCATCKNINHFCKGKCLCRTFAKNGFLAGLNEGKPKWHKVADGDLPKDENDVLVYSGEDWRMCVGRYSPKYKAWETGCDTIAWCEIPKYTEE